MTDRLTLDFYTRDAITVARALLGQRLVRILGNGTRLAGTIVETEAYLGIADKAAHTYNGRRTKRNASMWLGGGHTYVYFTYGMHHCMNVVASQPEQPVAVLIRALEPTEGIDVMRSHRVGKQRKKSTGGNDASTSPMRPMQLCSGPAKLCQAVDIDRALDGVNLTAPGDLFIERMRRRSLPDRLIVATSRVGVAYAEDWAGKPFRYYIRNHPHISRP